MWFTKRLWKDRQTEFPNRRTVTYEDGSAALVRLTRTEGEISEEGDAFNAQNMNDLEERIANADNQITETIRNMLQNSSDANDSFKKAINDIKYTLNNRFSMAEGIGYVKKVLPHTTYSLNVKFSSAEQEYFPIGIIDASCSTPGVVIGSMKLYTIKSDFGYDVFITNTTDLSYDDVRVIITVLLANWEV